MPEVLREGGVPDILADDAREGISPDDFPSCDVCDIFPSTPLPIPPLSLASLLYEQKCKLRGYVCTYHAAGRQETALASNAISLWLSAFNVCPSMPSCSRPLPW